MSEQTKRPDNGYYLELCVKNHKLCDDPFFIPLEDSKPIEVYNKYLETCKQKKYDYVVLRHFNGWCHDLISEWALRENFIFWYTTYKAYKDFCAECGMIPRKCGEEVERLEVKTA